MYYRTKINSETGKKFQELLDKAKACDKAAIEFKDKINADAFRPGYWSVFGGISSIIFNEKPDPSVFKKSSVQGEYLPKKTGKGKELHKEIEALPTIERRELNEVVNVNPNNHNIDFSHIGFNKKDEHFYFCLNSQLIEGYKKPEDCEEIKFSEYPK